MDELDIQLKTISYLKIFEDDVKALTKKLMLRYKEKPDEDGRIVCNVTVNICTNLIINTAPKELWHPMMINIALAMADVIKRGKGGR